MQLHVIIESRQTMNQKLPVDIIEAYAFANTPAYLFKKLSSNEYVTKLTEYKTEELIGYISSSNSESIESVAAAYAAIIALMRKNTDLSSAFNLSATKKLEWAPALISLYKQKVSSTAIQTIKVPSISSKTQGSQSVNELTNYTITKAQNS